MSRERDRSSEMDNSVSELEFLRKLTEAFYWKLKHIAYIRTADMNFRQNCRVQIEELQSLIAEWRVRYKRPEPVNLYHADVSIGSLWPDRHGRMWRAIDVWKGRPEGGQPMKIIKWQGPVDLPGEEQDTHSSYYYGHDTIIETTVF